MTLLVTFLILCGDTLTLTNGEIFVGKVVAQNEQRVWLTLGKGGTLSFERERIATLVVAGVKAAAKSDAATPVSVEKPKVVSKLVVPAPAPSKRPEAGRAPPAGVPPNASTHEETARYALKCPSGFQKDPAAAKAPLVCVWREASTGAYIALSAEPCQKGIDEAVEQARTEIGATLLVEREFRMKAAALDGRLFEREVTSGTETRGELHVVFVHGDVKFKLVGSVRKDLLDQYRDLFNDTFASFTLAKVKAAPDAAAPSVQESSVAP